MFCFLEEIEIKTDRCPVKCIYRTSTKSCGYRQLTPDIDENNNEIPVTALKVSKVKGIKLYKVKEKAAEAKRSIRIGLLILGFADFIKRRNPIEVGAEIKDRLDFEKQNPKEEQSLDHQRVDAVEKVLLTIFGLGTEHQQMFFDSSVFKEWKAKEKLDIEMKDIFWCLDQVSNSVIKPQIKRQSTQG